MVEMTTWTLLDDLSTPEHCDRGEHLAAEIRARLEEKGFTEEWYNNLSAKEEAMEAHDLRPKIFWDGQRVRKLVWPDESVVEVGKFGVEKIEVVMEYGQINEMLWFGVWENGVMKYKHNGAHIASVEL